MIESHEWDGDWNAVSIDEASWAEVEIQRELAPGHLLFGQRFTALARHWRRDDFLFQLADGRFAQIHLTRRIETGPRWPVSEIYETLEQWRAIPPEDR